MSRGFFPLVASSLVLFMGIVVLVQAFREKVDIPFSWPPLRPMLAIIGILLFALTVRPLGFVVSSALLIGVAGLAHTQNRVVDIVGSAVALIVGSWLLFIVFLGAPLHLWPRF
jgi:hypothetical protein